MQEQQPHEKHRAQGKTVIVAAGSLEGSSNLPTVTILPMPGPLGERAHPGSQSLKKETEGGEKKKAELSVTVTKTECKAKQKRSCKDVCPMSMPLLEPIIKNNYADSDVTLPPSCNDFLAAFNPACLTMYCAVQTVTQTLGAPKAAGNNREQFGLHPPSFSFPFRMSYRAKRSITAISTAGY